MSVECEAPEVEPRRRVAGWAVAAIVLFVIHAALALGPLRLNTDAARYLEAAANLADGHGYTIADSEFLVFPPGYSLFVAGLDLMGLAKAPMLTFAGVGLYAIGAWFMSGLVTVGGADRWRAMALSLASSVALRHTALPISEHLFVAVTGVALALGARAGEGCTPAGRAGWLAAAMVLAAISILIRTVGICTVLAILWCALELRLGRTRLLELKYPFLIAAAAAGIGMLLATPYGAGIRGMALDGARLAAHGRGVGLDVLEAFGNVPVPWRTGATGAFAAAAGAGLLVAAAKSIPWHAASPAVPFMAGYGAAIVVWPYEDPRFWLPLVPLALPCLVGMLAERHPTLARVHLAVVLAGAVAVAGHQARIALTGSRMPEQYYAMRAPHLARDYDLAWSSLPDGEISRYARVIRRFESRWRRYASERSRAETFPEGSSRNPG